MERLQYVVLAPLIGAMSPGVASGVWVVTSMHAADAVTGARAKCLRPGDYEWTRAVAAVTSTVLDSISKAT
jgi:hypothetical protein